MEIPPTSFTFGFYTTHAPTDDMVNIRESKRQINNNNIIIIIIPRVLKK